MSAEPFHTLLKRLREQRGISQRQLARLVHFDPGHLSKIENGIRRPSIPLAQSLDTALNAGGTLVAITRAEVANSPRRSARAANRKMIASQDDPSAHARPLGLPPGVPVPDQATIAYIERLHDTIETTPVDVNRALEFALHWRHGIEIVTDLWRQDMERREFLRRAAFTTSAFAAPAVRWLTAPLDDMPTNAGHQTISEPDVETVRQITRTLRALDNQYGGGHIRDMAVRFLHADVAPLLRDGRFDPDIGVPLFSAAAELTQLAGWASYDAGLHGLGQRYLIQALRLALTASDHSLGAEILAAMSSQAAYLGHAADAVDLARAAGRAAAATGVEALSAEAAVLEAHGHAVAGDEAACATALDRAEKTLDRADRSGDPQWIGYFDEAYLSAKFGHCFAALSQGHLAERFARRSLDMDDRYVRGRQFNLALLSRAHAQAGDVDQAAAVGIQAIDLAERLRSKRASEYIEDIARRLATHVGIAAVDDFADRARALRAQG